MPSLSGGELIAETVALLCSLHRKRNAYGGLESNFPPRVYLPEDLGHWDQVTAESNAEIQLKRKSYQLNPITIMTLDVQRLLTGVGAIKFGNEPDGEEECWQLPGQNGRIVLANQQDGQFGTLYRASGSAKEWLEAAAEYAQMRLQVGSQSSWELFVLMSGHDYESDFAEDLRRLWVGVTSVADFHKFATTYSIPCQAALPSFFPSTCASLKW